MMVSRQQLPSRHASRSPAIVQLPHHSPDDDRSVNIRVVSLQQSKPTAVTTAAVERSEGRVVRSSVSSSVIRWSTAADQQQSVGEQDGQEGRLAGRR